MSREKKKRTAKSFLGRKYGKSAFKTGSKKETAVPGKPRPKRSKDVKKGAKKVRQKSLYQKYLDSNPELKAKQQQTQAPQPAAKSAVVEKPQQLSAEEKALQKLVQDPKLQAIEARLERGEPLSPQDELYLEQKMCERQQLIEQIEAEDEDGREDDLFSQFEKSRFF